MNSCVDTSLDPQLEFASLNSLGPVLHLTSQRDLGAAGPLCVNCRTYFG